MAPGAVSVGSLTDNISIGSSDIVRIFFDLADDVGISVHRDVIGSSSRVFRRYFALPGLVSKRVSNVKSVHFEVYVDWLYTSIVRVNKTRVIALDMLIQLYFLADNLQDIKFRNIIITVLLKDVQGPPRPAGQYRPPDVACIKQAYEGNDDIATDDILPLQRALVEIYARQEDARHLEAIKDEVHRDFLRDLSLRLMDTRLVKCKNMMDVDICKFHKHKPERRAPSRSRPRSVVGRSEKPDVLAVVRGGDVTTCECKPV